MSDFGRSINRVDVVLSGGLIGSGGCKGSLDKKRATNDTDEVGKARRSTGVSSYQDRARGIIMVSQSGTRAPKSERNGGEPQVRGPGNFCLRGCDAPSVIKIFNVRSKDVAGKSAVGLGESAVTGMVEGRGGLARRRF